MKGPTREWVMFEDPAEEGRVWQIDVTFLLSSWQCIFGNGCQGNLTEPAPELEWGCCSYGAHFSDKADRDHIVKIARKLDPSGWQYAKVGRRKGIFATIGKHDDGTPDSRTRLVDDACIFLNRVGFENGPGCALHQYALREGLHPHEVKPEVCWQLPLRRVDDEQPDGSVISRLTEFGREGWGEGGDDFAWWCTEAPEAFTATSPVYVSLAPELRAMLGAKLYRRVAAYLDERRTASPRPIRHPAERPVTLGTTRRKR